MKVIYQWLCCFVLLTALHTSNAQTLALDTLYVTELRARDSISVQTLTDGINLKSTLQSTSYVSLNLQGVNSLATVINRGLPSKLFGVMYHGLRLNSITNSTFDINLLPDFYFNNISLNAAGNISSAVFNSPAGMVDLKQKNKANTISFGQIYQTANDVETHILLNAKNNKSELNLGGNIIHFNNRFDFNRSDVKQKSENNSTQGYNIMADVSHPFNSKSKLEIGFWLQDIKRELAEIYHTHGDQVQSDHNLRTYANYSTLISENIIKLNMVFADEDLIYQTSTIYSIARTQSSMVTASIKIKNNWQLQLGNKYDKAKANFFSQTKFRNDLFASLSKKLSYKNLIMETMLIQHLVDQKPTPVAGEVTLRKNDLKFTVIKNYSLPGFNDLFWPIGGNIDLKAERSWQLSADYSQKAHKNILIKASIYSYRIADFIQWLPSDNGYWSPINVRKIWSRGIETSFDYHSKLGCFDFRNTYLYTITKSTYEDSEAQKGKQLIYVPLHKMSNTTHIGKKKVNLLLNILFNGRRYETTDNFTSLDPYLVFNSKINYSVNIKTMQSNIGIGIENIGNTNYEYVRSFPMPLRRYVFEIKINFNHKKNTNEIN